LQFWVQRAQLAPRPLDVVEANPERFVVEVLTAGRQADLLITQAIKFKPNTVVIGDESQYDKVFAALDSHGIKVYAGTQALSSVVQIGFT
jgi:1-deoxy-D-xylulose-5-phosphate reductoisomerase